MKIYPAIHNPNNHASKHANISCSPTNSILAIHDTFTHDRACRIGLLNSQCMQGTFILQFLRPAHSLSHLNHSSERWQVTWVWNMETRATGKRPCTQVPEDPPGRRPSKDLKRATEVAHFYTQFTPPQVQQDIKEMENRVWQKVVQGKEDGELDEFKQWVKDPGYTTGRLALYDRALAYYWAAKQLYGMLLDKRSTKARSEREPEKLRKIHYKETHLVHIKLDVIAKKLGIPFLPQDSAANLMKGEEKGKEDTVPAPPHQ